MNENAEAKQARTMTHFEERHASVLDALNNLDHNASLLADNLESVLLPANPDRETEGSEEGDRSESLMSQRMKNIEDRIRSTSELLVKTINRLDL